MKLWCFFAIFGPFCAHINGSEPSPCTTPNGESAFCIKLRMCPVVNKSYRSKDESLTHFAEESFCGKSMVCCGTVGNYTQSNTLQKTELSKESKRDYALKNLLPNTTYCGMQHTDDYFYNETQASVDEFPWLLLVYYEETIRIKRSPASKSIRSTEVISILGGHCCDDVVWEIPKVTYKCTGVLISQRYGLTSSTCATEKSMWVALRQYDENKNVSCIKTSYGDDGCTDPVVNVSVTEQIRSPNGKLLLLRLEKEINYSDYIRPICLPLEESIRTKNGDILVTSGWDYDFTDNHNGTEIKKRIEQNVTNAEECKEDNISVNPICTRLLNGTNYVCESDRGGPLMYRYQTRNWYVEGLLNLDRCVNETVSGERLTPDVMLWILENMKD